MKKVKPQPVPEKDLVFEKENEEHKKRVLKVGEFLNIEITNDTFLPHLISSFMVKMIGEIETLKNTKQNKHKPLKS